MQRAPPAHREIDDGHVDDAGQQQDGAAAVGAARVVGRRLQGHEAQVQGQQDQFRGQPRIPDPPRAPGGLAPQRAGP
ncbi:hypothetical protein G6F68_017048 [Rhizopus microsporus]|nr:hypothetical protein G6F68_017048 [Rhizopus microsporus]